MSKAITNLQAAQQRAMAGRPKVGGFPYLAETLRRAGVTRNLWFLPSCQSLYLTEHGTVVALGTPLGPAPWMCLRSTRRRSSRRYGPTRPGRARFPSSLRHRGAPGLSATTSILSRARSPTMAVRRGVYRRLSCRRGGVRDVQSERCDPFRGRSASGVCPWAAGSKSVPLPTAAQFES
jgi:hypothetical protein